MATATAAATATAMGDGEENPNLYTVPKSSGKKITLRTADGDIFEVEEAVAMELQIIKSFFEEDGVSYDTILPLPNVSSTALVEIIRYCRWAIEYRAQLAAAGDDDGEKKKAEQEKKAFEEEFVSVMSNEGLKELIIAVNYLNSKDMLPFLLQAAADRIKNKSVEYVRQFFEIENDYTPEEEMLLRQEYAWAFEGVDSD